MSIKNLNENAKKIDNFLKNYFTKQDSSDLIKPMKYGTLSGGKKNSIFNNYCNWQNLWN